MERRNKITLEQLLQLKRAERPSPEFWDNFDRELRAKQLAALVQTRPWWQTLVTRKTLVRVCVPLGAAAVVAMSFGSFHSLASRSGEVQVARMQTGSAAKVAMQEENLPAPAAALTLAETKAQPEQSAQVSQPVMIASNEKAQEAAGQVWAAGAATVKAAGLALAQLAGSNSETPVSVAMIQPRMTEPLSQVATPRDNRRSRLLAYSVTYDPHAANSADSARTRDHIARRISDDAVLDSISRLGVSGNSVSIKF